MGPHQPTPKTQTNIIKEDDNEDLANEKHYIWIDANINQEWFIIQFNKIFNEKENKRKCLKCDSVDKGIEELIKLKFKEITIIISGKLFQKFCKQFNKKIDEIKICPSIIIFCGEKEYFISNLKINNNYINNHLLNKEYILTKSDDVIDILNGKNKTKIKVEDFTFDEIEDIRELIIPCFYSYLIQDVSETEILLYNQNIISGYHDRFKNIQNQIRGLISQLERSNLYSKVIISKYWLNVYTRPSDFYSQLNKGFRKKEENMYLYHPLIKICYEGIRKKFLNYKINKKLYICSLI